MNKNSRWLFLVDPSPWPFIAGSSALMLTFGFVLYFHGYNGGVFLFHLGFFIKTVVICFWWKNLVADARNTLSVPSFVLYILSEIMFFFCFFWAFLHSSFNLCPVLASHFLTLLFVKAVFLVGIIIWGIKKTFDSNSTT